MKKKFFVYRQRDCANTYIKTLVEAGYEETRDIAQADFFLYDHELRLTRVWDAIKDKPTFIYPHTPYSWFIWDGLCPICPASCNFVAGENAKLGLESFGYPNRVEVCGFSRCEVLPFRPSLGKRLLFAPAHPLMNKRFPNKEDYKIHRFAFDWVVEYASFFEQVTVRIFGSVEQNGFYEARGVKFEDASVSARYTEALTVASSIASIERHDLIISCNTFGYLSLARGKPTILYGNTLPRTQEGGVRNYPLYQHLIDFPRPLETLSIADVLMACSSIDPKVEEWTAKTIGGNFNAGKFLSVIQEYVS